MLVIERKHGQRIILEASDRTVEIVLFNLQQGNDIICRTLRDTCSL